MSGHCRGALALLGILICPVVASATTANDICGPLVDPCTLTTTIAVTPASTLDFGSRRFQISANGRLRVGFADMLTIRARSVTLGAGALIDHVAGSGFGARLVIEATEDIRLQRSGVARARINLSSAQGNGTLTLTALRDVLVDGDIAAAGTTSSGDGGTVRVRAGRDVTLTGDVRLFGGAPDGAGGDLDVDAEGTVVANGAIIDASGGFGGGDIDLDGRLGVIAGATLDVSGTAAETDAGTIVLESALGDVRVQGPIVGSGRGSVDFGGAGADVTVTAGGTVRLEAPMALTGGVPDGDGGVLDVAAGFDILQTAVIDAQAGGIEGVGDTIDFEAGRLLRLAALVDGHGGQEGGGADVSGRGAEVRAEAEINVNGDRGSIDLRTRKVTATALVVTGPVTVSGDLHALGLGTGAGGDITLEGCDVTLAASGKLRTTGASGGTNLLQASRQLRVGGILAATPGGANRLEYRDPARPPTILPTASITPLATTTLDTTLNPCQAPVVATCGNGTPEPGESCDDGNRTACDGCSATCRIESCGNGVRECTETCDDGDAVDGDGCDANCTPSGCGNGIVAGTEQCDDGNKTNGDGCSATCVLERPPGCGDRVVGAGEQCDDGNATACDGCSLSCLLEVCGNNVVQCQEQCDDGNTSAGDGCSPTCRLEGCGDGIVAIDEQCDDGNTVSGDCCSASCQREASLDIDGDGFTLVPTDLVYIARRLFGLPPVPPSYRISDPSIPTDDVITVRVDMLGGLLDVDASGAVSVASDIVYIARRVSGLPPVPPSFRTADPTIPPDATIISTIGNVCGGP